MPGNPIADVIDTTAPSVMQDPQRTLHGFVEFAKQSVEFQRIHYGQLVRITEGHGALSERLYDAISLALWLGFECGKNYIINGYVEEMLRLQDEWERRKPTE